MFFLIPYGHEKQTVQRIPVITVILIAINLLVFLFTHYSEQSWEAIMQKHGELVEYVYMHPYLQLPEGAKEFFEEWQLEELESFREMHVLSDLDPVVVAGEQKRLNELVSELKELQSQNAFQKYGYMPGKPNAIKLITSLFIHAGWLHLLGNMFFLYLAGCSIEDLWGRPLYTAFYFVSGIAATLSHALKFSDGMEPLIGASGAIAGLMGAFLIRLYNTQISFFYMLGIWFRGTFKAPAFLMLPLWLLSQIFYAMVDPEGSSGVAFWAHIGGFVFGALVALGFRHWRIEERFITPEIEKKISLVQNPDFLRGMELSGKQQFAEALIYLHRAVRSEPTHVDAFLEMRRIARIQEDAELYKDATGSALDILIRNREEELVREIHHEYRSSGFGGALASRTLIGLGMFYEDTGNFAEAEALYRSVADHYPGDPLALKALSRLSRLYFERLRNPEKGAQVFEEAYYHPTATDEWRAAMETDRKKYNIPVASAQAQPSHASLDSAPAHAAPAAAAFQATEQVIRNSRMSTSPVVSSASSVSPSTRSAPQESSTTGKEHPDSGFRVIPARLEKMSLQGLNLLLPDGAAEFLPWRKIRQVSSARIRPEDPASPGLESQDLVLDLVSRPEQAEDLTLHRLSSRDLAFDRIFPGVEQTFEEAFQNFVGIILNNSRAEAIPNRQSCLGPGFPSYPDLTRYETRLKARLLHS